MALLGSHLSIAGGYYKAVEMAAELRMDCVQIFTKNNNQWKGKPLADDDISRFREAIVRTGIRMPCAHDSYLINLASPDEALWSKSLEAFIIELERAEALGLVGVVMHPGASVGCERRGSPRTDRDGDSSGRWKRRTASPSKSGWRRLPAKARPWATASSNCGRSSTGWRCTRESAFASTVVICWPRVIR